MNSIGDYKQDKLNIVLTIEGGHNLFDNTSDSSVYGDVIQHLKDLKSSSHTYLFMGLAHLEHNPLCTHAYGIKFIKHDDFKPVGSGISTLGKDVIREALKKPNRILIDIKHMSLEARKQYYYILENEYNSERIPILISHGGVTGVSWDNKPVSCRRKYRDCIKVTYFKPKGVMGTKFNPWSINLYDEEIRKIVRSDGLIGLNLDERILGAKRKRRRERVEYFSPGEFNHRDYRKQFLRSLFALD
jgi:microsomal dipeptidase-like Zn-dependent dipeptidase